jgi:hypothetical protein
MSVSTEANKNERQLLGFIELKGQDFYDVSKENFGM